MKKEYTIKKKKDGDYEVTLHNQSTTFSLKEVVVSYMEAERALKEVESQRRLNRAVNQNIKDHHTDVIAMFNKLPKVKRAALINHIELFTIMNKDEVKYSDAKKRYTRLKSELAAIHAVIPAEEKTLTRSEQRRIKEMKK
jgi:hypothetical protein